MNIQQMRILIAVIDEGSFAAAGDSVGRSHSAISLQIKALEQELGLALFDRMVRPPAPTPKAKALVDHARKVVKLFDATQTIVTGQVVHGRLRVGAVPTVLGSFLPGALATLRTHHPDLSIDVHSGGSDKLAEQLQRGALDIAICTRPPQPMAGLAWHHIAREPLVVIAPEDTAGGERDLLTSNPFIWFNRKTWAGGAIESHLEARGLEVNATMEIDSLDAIETLVREGLGVSIVPVCRGREASWPGLRAVPFGDPPFVRDVGALLMAEAPEDPLIKAFLRAL
ncbi:LysR substrate-binding domain-containing protein [Roseobacter sinensis]|uniref:LysR substrate-binding domain-containing protein n=1 Tax=Roseobacter sinensis TaxID=2931391 RepID=A0ABT3BDC2_9RHOB|nr:LysR substrate-binding domain-containing protein [Roseobacter sp. WL0113]MCV3271404.1 LysR substrate-binding domain-containing protein [Roseobacter sp. WL0113]